MAKSYRAIHRTGCANWNIEVYDQDNRELSLYLEYLSENERYEVKTDYPGWRYVERSPQPLAFSTKAEAEGWIKNVILGLLHNDKVGSWIP